MRVPVCQCAGVAARALVRFGETDGLVLRGGARAQNHIMSEDEDNFVAAGSGASLTVPQQASALRKGGFVIVRGFPCKVCSCLFGFSSPCASFVFFSTRIAALQVMNMSTSKTGKHGGAKIHMTAIDIFTGRKYEEIFSSTENIDVPLVSKAEYQVSFSVRCGKKKCAFSLKAPFCRF